MMIRAIIFDLGGVLLRTADFTPREQLAERLGMSRHELQMFIFGGDSGDRAQKGEISVQVHLENLRHQLDYSPAEFESLLDEFFANDELDNVLLDYVRKLHKSYKTGLLSNAFDNLRQVIATRWQFEDAFDDMIISAEVGLVKPDARIFLLTVERLGIEADQAIFVDDMEHNVEGAKRVGLHGIHFKNPTQMQLEMAQLLDGHCG